MRSTIADNTVQAFNGYNSLSDGGGILAQRVTLDTSTISGNVAGLLDALPYQSTAPGRRHRRRLRP